MKEDRFFINHLRISFSLKDSDVQDIREVTRYGYESHSTLYDVDVIPTKDGTTHEVHYSKNCSRCEPTKMHRAIQNRFGIKTRPVEDWFCAEELVI